VCERISTQTPWIHPGPKIRFRFRDSESEKETHSQWSFSNLRYLLHERDHEVWSELGDEALDLSCLLGSLDTAGGIDHQAHAIKVRNNLIGIFLICCMLSVHLDLDLVNLSLDVLINRWRRRCRSRCRSRIRR
jgi:hypothetical protein